MFSLFKPNHYAGRTEEAKLSKESSSGSLHVYTLFMCPACHVICELQFIESEGEHILCFYLRQ